MLSFGRRVFVSSALAACVFTSMAADARAESSSFTGRRLGRNRHGEEVKVTREVGTGYALRWQAAAAARMTGSEAVLVKARDGKWHACATTANAFDGITPADDTDVRELRPLASPRNLGDLKKRTPDKAWIALVLGLEEKEIATWRSSNDRKAAFVNVTANLPYPGTHGPESSSGEGFSADAATAIELNRSLFQNVDVPRAAAVLFHETIHLADDDLAKRAARQRSTRDLDRDDAQIALDIAVRAHGTTEARAYVGTFIAALQAGAGDLAEEQLLTYVKRLGVRDGVPEPKEGPVTQALRSDLGKARASLDAKGKRDFDEAMRAAKRAAPKAWIFDRASGRRA